MITLSSCTKEHNAQLSGEDAEDQIVIHNLTAGASTERSQGVTSTECYMPHFWFVKNEKSK